MKKKLDWFKLDCQLDEKMELIEAEFGLTGFAIVVRLFQRIYGGEGYYCEWNEDVALVFSKKNGLGANVVSEIIKASLKRGIFNSELFKKYGILTSHGIQQRYSECANRRVFLKIKPEYLLLCNTQNSDDADISSENAYNSQKNVYNSDTEEKREEENRIDEKRAEENSSAQPLCTYGEFGHIKLTDEQYQNLVYEYGAPNIRNYIRKMDDWLEANNKTYNNCYIRLRQWLDKDGIKKDSNDGFDPEKYKILINNV